MPAITLATGEDLKINKGKLILTSKYEHRLVLEFPAKLYPRFLDLLIALQQEGYAFQADCHAQGIIAEVYEDLIPVC